MKKYKMQTWKLIVEGEYHSEKEAIKDLSDRYMKCSKCDPPGEHFAEMFNNISYRNLDNIGKGVYFYVYEKVYGNPQWIIKYEMTIHPFKPEHWWPSENSEWVGPRRKFKYEIKCPIETKKLEI